MKRALSTITVLCTICFLQPTFAAEVRIDQVEVLGVSALTSDQVEALLDVDAGMPLDRRSVIRSTEAIQQVYLVKGYAQARVKSEFVKKKTQDGSVQNVLVFRVEEGLPTRIATFGLTPAKSEGGAAGDEYWRSILKRLEGHIDIKPGDPLDQERLGALKREIDSLMISEDLVGGQVGQVRISDHSEKLVDSGQAAARWVDVRFEMSLGSRVTFGFIGNSVLTRSDLRAVVDAQRQLGFGRDYVEQVLRRITESYHALGYSEASVETFTFEKSEFERRVVYRILEGSRTRIGSIQFDGNVIFSDRELRSKFYQGGASLLNRGIYVEKEVDSASERLLEWLRSEGYLFSKIITVSKNYNAKQEEMNLLIYLYEGEQTLVRNIEIEGLNQIDRNTALEMLGVRSGDPLNLYRFNQGLEMLKSRYQSIGYLDMKIENESKPEVVRYHQQNRNADIRVLVSEGPPSIAGKTEIEGLEKTLPHVVLRELTYLQGEPVTSDLLLESEARIRRLGIFSSVNLSAYPHSKTPGLKDIKIIVEEFDPGVWAAGVGFRNDTGVRVFGEVGYTNIFGRNHAVTLGGNINRRLDGYTESLGAEYEVKTGYYWPWFILNELAFRPELSFDRKKYANFNATSLIAKAQFDRRVARKIPVFLGLTYSLERIRQFDARDDEFENRDLQIGAITARIVLDLLDNPVVPRSGFYSSASYDLALPSLGSQGYPLPISYSRLQFRADGYVPLTPNVTWYMSFRTGFAMNLIDPADPRISSPALVGLPLIKHFVVGGESSLRGYRNFEINERTRQIQGTLSYVIYRTQVHFPLMGSLRMGPFIDAANLMVDRYSLGNLLYSAGVGFKYETPVGPLNFDIGFKINPPTEYSETRFGFHFSVGAL